MPQQIFISYSRKDSAFVRKLAGDLEKAGYEVWWDVSDLRGGDDWVRVIPEAIASSSAVIVVLSPNAVASDWVKKEYTQALSLHKKVIPIMLQQIGVPFALNTINFVDFTSDDYPANFNNLLKALGYTGEPPVVTPPSPALISLRKYGIPIGIGVLLVLVFLARAFFAPTPPPDATPSSAPTNTAVILVDTDTPTVSPTDSPTPTATSTLIEPTPTDTASPTSTPTQTATFTPTLPPAVALPICVYNRDGRDANVREGPGTDRYIVVGELRGDGSKCPLFSGYSRNRDQEIWFQFAESQAPEFQDFAGRWVSADVLAATDLRLLPLPICIYDSSATVPVRLLPAESSDPLGEPVAAEGSNCPFFTTRLENSEGTWYRFASDQKEKEEQFRQYAGGWIRADSLVVRTLVLPTITTIPTPAPTSTPTSTFTPTPTETATPTPTETPPS